ncbi:hypothetical protein WMY93_016745 [Mugilogobius chulae]|uniref:Ig-like domain-containing protein n=1 Tax=Mugilogobius chulae TaxID=88201 RepID=A0AAW0NMD4_9GOBI
MCDHPRDFATTWMYFFRQRPGERGFMLVAEATIFSRAADVTQTDMLWTSQGKEATMKCSQTKGATYYQMYWYQQKPGENMRQIVFTSVNIEPKFESDFKERFKVTKPDAASGTLTVENLEPADSGVYFCSVSEHRTAKGADADVTQTEIMWMKEGEEATMHCSHKKSGTYLQMYWYRQRPGENMRQIVFTFPNAKPDFEPDFRDSSRFGATKPDAKSGTLTVENLQPGDSGVYFALSVNTQ